MSYRKQNLTGRNEKNLIIYIILWVVLALYIMPAFSYSKFVAGQTSMFDITSFVLTFFQSLINPLKAIGEIFAQKILLSYLGDLLIASVIFSIFLFIGIIRNKPKNQYKNIEHGSSSWSYHGEQYRILNKNKGIILAKGNYLPVNKVGNVNVLVVGRIWIR